MMAKVINFFQALSEKKTLKDLHKNGKKTLRLPEITKNVYQLLKRLFLKKSDLQF